MKSIVTYSPIDWLFDHVDGMRLRLWTATTNGPIVYPSGGIWAWKTMVEWYRQRKTSDSALELPGNPTSSRIVASRRSGWNKWWIRPWKVSLFIRSKWFLHTIKSYDMGPSNLLSLQRRVCCAFLSPLKMHGLFRVWTRDPWVQCLARQSLHHRGFTMLLAWLD
jgi:hypothetical protein